MFSSVSPQYGEIIISLLFFLSLMSQIPQLNEKCACMCMCVCL